MQEGCEILDVRRELTICYCNRSQSVAIDKTLLLYVSCRDE